jgi:hypothetical protein
MVQQTSIQTETPTTTPSPTSTSTPMATLTLTPSSTETPTPTPVTSRCPTPTTPLPKNTELTKCAWDFFNAGMYDQSIIAAEECIDQFESQAIQEQQEFTASGKPAPPIGEPPDVITRDETLARGPLNDVATCYFIKGWSLEKLDSISEAKEAYMSTQQFPDARAWDLAGFFWSPAQEASNRFAKLPK